MIESLYSPQKAPIFKETFVSEQTTRANGGVPTSVTYSDGTCAFNGSSSSVRYNKNFNGVYSLRIKFSSITYQASKYVIDFRSLSGAGTGYIFFTGGIFGISSGTTYINGVATTAFSSGANDVVITGMTISSSLISLMYNYLNAFYTAGTIELLEIYEGTLTANEVANLYNNKRYDDVSFAASNIGFTTSAAVSNNLVESNSLSWTSTSGGTFIVKYSTTNNNQTGSLFFMDSASTRIWGVQVAVAKTFNFFFGAGFARVATSTASVASDFNGYVKVWARTSGSDMLIDFYQSTDGVTYTQLGATVTNVGGANSFVSGTTTAQVAVNGTAPGGNPFIGTVYEAYAYDSSGNLVISFNNLIRGGNGTSFRSSTSHTWTVYSSGVGSITSGTTEILNIDAKNGVIANKYSGNKINDTDLILGWNFTNWIVSGGCIISNSNTFTNTSSGGIYKNLSLSAGKRYRITIVGTTTSPTGINITDGSATVTGMTIPTGTFNTFFETNWTGGNPNLFFQTTGVSSTTITNFVIQELIPNIINTSVVPVRSGNIWAMGFNGSSSKLDCGSYDTLVGNKSFVAWIKAERISSSSLEYIFNNGSLLFAIDNGTWYVSNGIVVSSDGSFGVPAAYSASNVIKRMTPFQVVVTRTSTGVANIYVNGVLTGSANQASGTPAAGSTNLTLGASSTSTNLLDGHMSGVRIIDGILSAQEVSQLFSAERKNYGI